MNKPNNVDENEREAYPGEQPVEIARLEYSSEMDDYVHRNLDLLKSLYREGKLSDPGHFPNFEELYRLLQTQLPRSDVRYAIRSLIRQHLEDERGEEFGSDFREDIQLQRAILEALIRLGRDPAQIAEYKDLAGAPRGKE